MNHDSKFEEMITTTDETIPITIEIIIGDL
jgi:hypothetical protein